MIEVNVLFKAYAKTLACLLLLMTSITTLAADDNPYKYDLPMSYNVHPDIDWPMFDMPHFEYMPDVWRFHPQLGPLWVESLRRPDVTTPVKACAAFVRAHQDGMEDVPEQAGGPLIDLLNTAGKDVRVYRAAVAAVVALDVRDAADALFAHDQQADREIVIMADDALARWDYAPARALWRQRIGDPSTRFYVKVSAIDALGSVHDADAVALLRALAVDRRGDPSIRIAAAEALGRYVDSGLVEPAQSLAGAADATVIDRLVAANLLNAHASGQAVSQLLTLGRDADPAVATVALRRLLTIDPRLLDGDIPQLIGAADVNHRRVAADVLFTRATPEAVTTMTGLLDDANTELRNDVRHKLLALAADDALDATVRSQGMNMLKDGGWRGVEQAALLLGKLDHEPAADLMLTHMTTHSRHEARLAAIAGLRWLAVERTYAPMLAWAKKLVEDPKHVESISADGDGLIHHRSSYSTGNMELTHLLQTLGLHEYEPGRAVARQMVARNDKYTGEARAAGIWALSRYFEDQVDQALAEQLVARLNDVFSMNPEIDIVRRFAGLTLGAMRAKGFEETITYHLVTYTGSRSRVQQTCRWALERITGDDYDPVEPLSRDARGWFIEPIDERD